MDFLGKFVLLVALFVGGGTIAWADDDIIVFDGSSIASGWQNGAGNSSNNYTIVSGELISNTSSYSRLQSTSAFSFENKRAIVKAKRMNTDESYIILYAGWSATTVKFGYNSSTASGNEIYSSDEYIELISDKFTVNNAKLDFRGKNVIIISIKIVDGGELTLDENNPTALIKGSKAESVRLKYTPSNNWNTICVPFQLRSSNYEHLTAIFGSDWQAYTLSSYDNGTLTFANATPYSYSSINANVPLLVYAPNAVTNNDGVELTANVSISYATSLATTKNDASFQGTYAPMSMEGKYGVTSSGQVMQGTATANIKGYRAYFTGINPPAGGARPTIVFEDDEDTQGLSAVMWMENTKDAYNLQGQKVEKGRKGIYIVNGRKVVIK